MDIMVLRTQQWLNATYSGKTGYTPLDLSEDSNIKGKTGWTTIYALLEALQIELGITATSHNFGPTTTSKFNARFPNGVQQQAPDDETEDNIYGIIQGACWCKGYSTSSSNITKHFYSGTGNAIKKLKEDAGCSDTSSTVTLNVMKALMSMNQFEIVDSGTDKIRTIQQNLNRKYEDYIGLIPCDGLYGREMNKALIKVLQAIEGLSPAEATGNFGVTTKARLPIVPNQGNLDADTEKKAILLARYALCCNGYSSVNITSETWDTNIRNAVSEFQSDMYLPDSLIVDTNTWMSLLLSCGNTERSCNACDTAYSMRDDRLQVLKREGIIAIGRYITGGSSKILDDGEIDRIINNGFKFIPIYQVDGTPTLEHFTSENGKEDARMARVRARSFKIPENSIIYFAVDIDAQDTDITNNVLPYFKAIKENLNKYKVGVDGTRNVCTKVMKNNYAESCYVSDMSTGYSGNMGFKMPENWNLDQYAEISLSADSGNFGIDKVMYSNKDTLVESLTGDPYLRGLVQDFSFVSHNVGSYKQYSGDKMYVYVSATKVSGNIPSDAKLLLQIVPHSSTVIPYNSEIHANLDGKIYDLGDSPNPREYLPIENGNSIAIEYFVIDSNNVLIENAEVNVHIEIETEYR